MLQYETCNEIITVEHLIKRCTKYTQEQIKNKIPNNFTDELENKRRMKKISSSI